MYGSGGANGAPKGYEVAGIVQNMVSQGAKYSRYGGDNSRC